MRKQVVVIFLLIITLSACEKDFTVLDQLNAKKLVVNSNFDTYYPLKVYITESSSPSKPNSKDTWNTSKVDLYEGNTFIETMNFVPSDSQKNFGSYQTALIPKEGKTYSLKIHDATYGDLFTKDSVPFSSPIISCSILQNGDSITKSMLELSFQDKLESENYYYIDVYFIATRSYIDSSGNLQQQTYYPVTAISTTSVSDGFNWSGYYIYFTDKDFNGRQKQLNVKFDGIVKDNFDSLSLVTALHTISKANYEYYKSLYLNRGSNSANSDPVSIFTNIQNGYGIFAAEVLEQKIIVIK